MVRMGLLSKAMAIIVMKTPNQCPLPKCKAGRKITLSLQPVDIQTAGCCSARSLFF
jgi:hypothetical protein